MNSNRWKTACAALALSGWLCGSTALAQPHHGNGHRVRSAGPQGERPLREAIRNSRQNQRAAGREHEREHEVEHEDGERGEHED